MVGFSNIGFPPPILPPSVYWFTPTPQERKTTKKTFSLVSTTTLGETTLMKLTIIIKAERQSLKPRSITYNDPNN